MMFPARDVACPYFFVTTALAGDRTSGAATAKPEIYAIQAALFSQLHCADSRRRCQLAKRGAQQAVTMTRITFWGHDDNLLVKKD